MGAFPTPNYARGTAPVPARQRHRRDRLGRACTLAAYLAGGTLQSLSATIELIIGGTAGLIIAAGLLLLRRHAGTLARRAEAAYPGPLN